MTGNKEKPEIGEVVILRGIEGHPELNAKYNGYLAVVTKLWDATVRVNISRGVGGYNLLLKRFERTGLNSVDYKFVYGEF